MKRHTSSEQQDAQPSAAPEPTGGLIATQEAEAAAALLADTLRNVRPRISLFVFRGFFEPLHPLRLDDALLTLVAPSDFHRDWLRDHYQDALDEAATAAAGRTVRVTVIHDPRLVPEGRLAAARETAALLEREAGESTPPRPAPTFDPPTAAEAFTAPAAAALPEPSTPFESRVVARRARPVRGTLHSRYTFDTYITGDSNRMAFAACEAVAEDPASRYSPLFLFGGTGLGKTHLLHAIGNAMLATHPGLRVVYMSAEEWVNEYITEIRHRRFDEFRARYRNGCDVLLLDDIQFLAGKDSSQDEFFHTFNSLYSSRRQIVVTSDRYPHEIEGLEERLKTRLEWGLIADVRPPDLETRFAILETKAETLGVHLEHDVLDLLATRISTSVRALEGALTRLHAWSTLTRETITVEHAREQLRAVLGEARALTLDGVMKTVAAYYDVRVQDLVAKGRQRQIALARQVAMYLCRKHLGKSFPELGRAFGGRDHTTALSSVRKIEALLGKDAGMQAVIARLERALVEGAGA
jgi:chromosomal replication initiator protein